MNKKMLCEDLMNKGFENSNFCDFVKTFDNIPLYLKVYSNLFGKITALGIIYKFENILEEFYINPKYLDKYIDDDTNISAFNFVINGKEYKNKGIVVFAIVGGAVELAFLTFTTLSIVYTKNKKEENI